jgi:hypothetical protein
LEGVYLPGEPGLEASGSILVDNPCAHGFIDYRNGRTKGGLGQAPVSSFNGPPQLFYGGPEIRF